MILSDDDESQLTLNAAAAPTTVTKTRKTVVRTPACKTSVKSESIKHEPSFNGSVLAAASTNLGETSDGLPQFVRAKWSTAFLPTAYHRLFCSTDPLREFNKGQSLIDILQELLDIVYEGHSYKVEWNDKIVQTVSHPCLLELL